jgi:hypothetical protein
MTEAETKAETVAETVTETIAETKAVTMHIVKWWQCRGFHSSLQRRLHHDELLEHLRTFYSQPGAPAALVASKLPALLRDTRLPADLQVPLDSTFDHLVAFGTCMLCGKRHRKTRGRR